MSCSLLQALAESEVLELSEDRLRVRSKTNPEKWPLEDSATPLPSLSPGVTKVLHANVPEFIPQKLHADVPEFVPGQMYTTQRSTEGKFPRQQITSKNV